MRQTPYVLDAFLLLKCLRTTMMRMTEIPKKQGTSLK